MPVSWDTTKLISCCVILQATWPKRRSSQWWWTCSSTRERMINCCRQSMFWVWVYVSQHQVSMGVFSDASTPILNTDWANELLQAIVLRSCFLALLATWMVTKLSNLAEPQVEHISAVFTTSLAISLGDNWLRVADRLITNNIRHFAKHLKH